MPIDSHAAAARGGPAAAIPGPVAHTRVDLAVPAYVHPLVDASTWRRLVLAARRLRFVIVNVDSGPGQALDEAYPPVIEALRWARVRCVGYVDTDYARRPVEDVVAQARSWVARYGVHGVFLDQVAGDFAHLEYYAACALGARAAGAQFVVVNPGTDCHPGYADLANVVITFEGTWQAYQGYLPRPWMLEHPAGRFAHLVHEAPAGQVATGPALAAARHAGTAFFTDGAGANPWDRLPADLVDAVQLAPPDAMPPPSVAAPGWGLRRYATPSPPAAGAPAVPAPRASRWARLRVLRRSPDPTGTAPTSAVPFPVEEK